MKLNICHLYPDVLNLYGDRGNVLCMKKRLEWRGIECEVTGLPIGARADLTRFDIFFIGGGQDFEQGLLLDDLKKGKAADIKAAVADGKTFLCICGGYQLMGRCYETHEGEKYDFLGAVDFYTKGSRERMIGNYAFRLNDDPRLVVAGFENHSGRTFLGKGVEPLGEVLTGFGNNGMDKGEGVSYNNMYGAYSHGPVLPKNPAFCDRLLLAALKRKQPSAELAPLPDVSENEAHRAILAKLRTGEAK